MTTNRRVFGIQSLTGLRALASLSMTQASHAQAAAVNEADPQATALGYRTDGTQVDPKKYPNYTSSQNCGGCVLYQGKSTEATGACPIFGNKLVTGKSWCNAWAKKA